MLDLFQQNSKKSFSNKPYDIIIVTLTVCQGMSAYNHHIDNVIKGRFF